LAKSWLGYHRVFEKKWGIQLSLKGGSTRGIVGGPIFKGEIGGKWGTTSGEKIRGSHSREDPHRGGPHKLKLPKSQKGGGCAV